MNLGSDGPRARRAAGMGAGTGGAAEAALTSACSLSCVRPGLSSRLLQVASRQQLRLMHLVVLGAVAVLMPGRPGPEPRAGDIEDLARHHPCHPLPAPSTSPAPPLPP